MSAKAVVLLSGGLDSTTVLAIAKSEGFQSVTVSFDYGQRHRVELEKAAELSRVMGAIDHRVVAVDIKQFGGSALTDDIPVPAGRSDSEIATGIPVTYVPARNTIFLSYALALAEVNEARDIFIGVNAVDYSGYPDCRPEYIEAFETMANLATKSGVENSGATPSDKENARIRIHTPLIDLTKAEIIQKGIALGVDYSKTHSCYDPDEVGLACGVCDSCVLRQKGFNDAGLTDPLPYRA